MTATGATPGKQVGTINLKAPGATRSPMLVLNRDGKVEEWKQWFPQWGNNYVREPIHDRQHVWFLDREARKSSWFSNRGKR